MSKNRKESTVNGRPALAVSVEELQRNGKRWSIYDPAFLLYPYAALSRYTLMPRGSYAACYTVGVYGHCVSNLARPHFLQ